LSLGGRDATAKTGVKTRLDEALLEFLMRGSSVFYGTKKKQENSHGNSTEGFHFNIGGGSEGFPTPFF
jgi:hypothetical protein